MSSSIKHYKFINSKTGNVIFYHSVDAALSEDELKEELRRVQERVATQNGVYAGTIYWEAIPDENE